ncbi:MAG: MBL fold metallo-hydrolase [bacterium]
MGPDYVDRIPLDMEWQYEDANVYLIRSDSGNWLIDAGEIYNTNFQFLTDELKDRGLSWNKIDGVCVTHLHPDHAGLCFDMLEANPDLQVLIPPGPAMDQRTRDRTQEWLNRVGMPEDFHEYILNDITSHKYVDFMGRLKDTAKFLETGQTLTLGDYQCDVIKAHGHTPNQVVFYLPEDELLFSGDHVLMNETPNVSLFPEYLGGNPLKDFHDSLESLLDLEISMVYPGHGVPFENGLSRIQELLDHHEERLEHCRQAMRKGPVTAFDVVQEIPWGSGDFDELDEIHQFLALGETMSHLIYLTEADNVHRNREDKEDYFKLSSDSRTSRSGSI